MCVRIITRFFVHGMIQEHLQALLRSLEASLGGSVKSFVYEIQ